MVRSAFFLLLAALLLGLSACTKSSKDEPGPNYSTLDRATIKAYIQANNLTGFQEIDDTTGVFVAITRPGTGPLAQNGQTLTVRSQASTFDGAVFNPTSQAPNEFSFKLGAQQVIKGWELAFQRLNEGSQATLLMTSPKGFGPNQVGPVPPNTVLRFEVELLRIQ